MKSINLPALGQVTLQEVNSFLFWLEQSPNGEVSSSQMERNPPMRSSKISPMIKVLEQFGFICRKENRIKITMTGKEFSQSQTSSKKAAIRALFTKLEPVQKILEHLKTSTTGSIRKYTVADYFDQVAESEVLAFISWGQTCELFDYDKKRDEIICFPSVKDPNSPGLPGSLASSQVRLSG